MLVRWISLLFNTYIDIYWRQSTNHDTKTVTKEALLVYAVMETGQSLRKLRLASPQAPDRLHNTHTTNRKQLKLLLNIQTLMC